MKEEEATKKFIYRLSTSERNFHFFRSNTLDYASFGYNKLRQGAQIGLPFSYFATSKSDASNLMPDDGFKNFLGHTISLKDLNTKLDQTQLESFFDSIILSQDAKLFGLAREIAKTDHFIKTNLDHLVDFVSLGGAFIYSFATTRAYKLQYFQRRRVFIMSSLIALCGIIGIRIFSKRINDKLQDYDACQIGLDCCEGSIEFYDKLLERNKLIRKVLPDGDKLIDQEGNYLKKEIKVPFMNQYFYMNYLGIKLTERREYCRKQLSEIVTKLTDKIAAEDAKKLNVNEVAQSDEETSKNDKELRIFKALRLKLENSKFKD